MDLDDALINDIGNINSEDLLLKSMLYLLFYQLKKKGNNTEEEPKNSFSLQDALDSVYKKRKINYMIPSPS